MNVVERHGVGIDVAAVDLVADSLHRFGDAYLTRVYTADEIAACGGAQPSPARLAARFAAKEAVVKALRPQDDAIDLRDIEVLVGPSRRIEVALRATAAALAARRGMVAVAVSVSAAAGMVTAIAVGTFDEGMRS